MENVNFSLESPNYEFDQVKFNVDGILSKNILEPFPNKSFFMCIVGKAGSGKTSLLINSLINKNIYKKVFDKLILVMPKNSRNSLKENPLDDLPEDQLYENFGVDVIEKVKSIREDFDKLNEEIEKKSKGKKKGRPRNQLLILDDVTAYLKDHPKELIELSTNRRHLKLSIILLSQYLRAIPRAVRFQVTDLAVFKPSNELDSKVIEEEFINLPKGVFKELTRFVWSNSHDYLFINKNNETFFKNLQKIIF